MPTNDNVNVKLGASSEGLDSALSAAASKMNMTFGGIIAGLLGLKRHSESAKAKIEADHLSIGKSFDGLVSKVNSVQSAMATPFLKLNAATGAFMLALGGGAAFSKFISQTNEYTSSVMRLATTLGIASDEASGLYERLTNVGADPDEFAFASRRFERQIRTNGDVLKKFGIDVDGIKKGTKSTGEEFEKALKIISEYSAGHAQTAVSMALLGTRVGDVQKMIKAMKSSQEEAMETMRSLGLVVTDESLKMKDAYKRSVEDSSTVLEGISKVIAEAVMPGLTNLGNWFKDIGPAAVSATRGAMWAFGQVMDSIKDVAKTVWEVIKSVWNTLKELAYRIFGRSGEATSSMEVFNNVLRIVAATATVVATGVKQAMTLIRGAVEWAAAAFELLTSAIDALKNRSLSGVVAAWQNYRTKVADIAKRTYDDVRTIGLEGRKKFEEQLLAEMPAGIGGKPRKPGGTKDAPGFLDEDKNKSDERMAKWREQLRQRIEAEVGYFNDSKELELAFWTEKLALVKGNGEKEVKIRREIESILYGLRKSAANKQLALDLKMMDDEISLARDNIDQQIALAKQKADIIAKYWDKEPERAAEALKKVTELELKKLAMITALEEKRADLAGKRAMADVADARATADFEVAVGKMSVQQRIALEEGFAEQDYAIAVDTIQRKATLERARLDAAKAGPLEYQKFELEIQSEMEGAERAHQARIVAIRRDAIKEAMRYENEAVNATRAALSQFISTLADRSKSLKDAFNDMVKSIAGSVNKLASDKIVETLLGSGTTGGNVLHDIFGTIFGTKGGAGATTGAQAAQAAMTGAATATGAFTVAVSQATTALAAMSMSGGGKAAAAGGNFLASLFGGGGGGGSGFVEGFAGVAELPFLAAGTNYVPRDMLAVVHKGEAVVPAKLNQPGRMGGGLHVTNHFVIQGGVDSRTQDQIAARASMAMQRAAYRVL